MLYSFFLLYMTDHYATLGVARTASANEIKRAYRKLASQHHPDKGGDVKKFQEIEQAYRVLSDPDQRAQYDNPQSQFGGFQFNGGSPFDFDSIFDIFGARFHNQQAQRPQQQARMTLWITLRDVAQGGRRTISVGTHAGTTAVDIEIPLGVEDGQGVKYPGIGPGGIDVVIIFRIHPSPGWERNGFDLHTTHSIPIWDLILGTDTPVKNILGRELSLTVPKGTQPGTVLRLRGQGLPARSGMAGDLLIHIQTRIPDNIPQAIIDAIEQNRT